jgi:hypothetical protein
LSHGALAAVKEAWPYASGPMSEHAAWVHHGGLLSGMELICERSLKNNERIFGAQDKQSP